MPEPNICTQRASKKQTPTSHGALKFAKQFGDVLVCVRHRMDDKGEFLYTTVELLVDKTAGRP